MEKHVCTQRRQPQQLVSQPATTCRIAPRHTLARHPTLRHRAMNSKKGCVYFLDFDFLDSTEIKSTRNSSRGSSMGVDSLIQGKWNQYENQQSPDVDLSSWFAGPWFRFKPLVKINKSTIWLIWDLDSHSLIQGKLDQGPNKSPRSLDFDSLRKSKSSTGPNQFQMWIQGWLIFEVYPPPPISSATANGYWLWCCPI